MTEQDWLACTDPENMLTFLQEQTSKRKLRLFAAACCRSITHLIDNERDKKTIDVLEQVADQAVKAAVLVQLRKDYNGRQVEPLRPYASRFPTWAVRRAIQPRVYNAAKDAAF